MSGSPHLWSPHFHPAPHQRVRATETAERAQARGVPPILTLRHLAEWSGADYSFLRAVVSRRAPNEYTRFKIRKRTGGTRPIAIPSFPLMRVHRWIHSHVLSHVVPHGRAFAYRRGRSAIDMARVHCGCRYLVKLDLQDFFGHITERRIFDAFLTLGYSRLVAFELSRICTYCRCGNCGDCQAKRCRSYSISAYSSHCSGVLPQGAPTSPVLSNMAAHNLDETLSRLSAARGFQYSRYADDLVFSTVSEFPVRQRGAFLRAVESVLATNRLPQNRAKTRILGPGSRRIVLGLLVDTSEPRLSRGFRKRLDLHLYYASTQGLSAHAQRRGFSSSVGLRRHLEGLIGYAEQVNPAYGRSAREKLRQAIAHG